MRVVLDSRGRVIAQGSECDGYAAEDQLTVIGPAFESEPEPAEQITQQVRDKWRAKFPPLPTGE